MDKARPLPVAARAAAHALRTKGYHTLARAERFYIDDKLGPLPDTELERATRWGAAHGKQLNAREVGT